MRIIPSLVVLSALLGSCTQLSTVSVDPGPTPPEIVAVRPVYPRCVPSSRPIDWEALARTLTEQRARWNALGQVNYAYTARVDSLVPQPPTRIEVRDNQVVSATVIATGQPVSAEGLRGYRTIDQFYAYYAVVIERERANTETCVARPTRDRLPGYDAWRAGRPGHHHPDGPRSQALSRPGTR